MKKIFFLCVMLCFFSSCSTYKLTNTVWFNVCPSELYGKKCSVVTSLYFWDENTMNINVCVKQDTAIIVPATMTANGTYKIKGNLKNGVKIKMIVKDSFNEKGIYQGIIKQEGMVLVSPDSIAKVYNKVSNVSLLPIKQ